MLQVKLRAKFSFSGSGEYNLPVKMQTTNKTHWVMAIAFIAPLIPFALAGIIITFSIKAIIIPAVVIKSTLLWPLSFRR